jgi:IclR family acetate operon transcriptional repressor
MERWVGPEMDRLSSVGKAMSLLACIARVDSPMSLAELTAASGFPKPTVHRLARALERERLVSRDALTGRYGVGQLFHDACLKVVRAGPAYAARHGLLEDLSQRLGETVNLGILSRAEVVYVDRVECSWPLRADFKPGSRVPAHCTASGKLLLAFSPPKEHAHIIRGMTLRRHTPGTITTRAALVRALRQTQKRGYSEDDEEFFAGVCGVAVPVTDETGRVVASLSVAAPSARFSLKMARQRVPDLKKCAALLGEFMPRQRL